MEEGDASERSLDGAVVSVCGPDGVAVLIGVLEGIATELSWQPGDQLRDDAPRAVHFAAGVDGVLAGGLQLVPYTQGHALPCERVWPDHRLPRPERTAHISVLAVTREHRGSAGLLWPLCVAMWRHCAEHKILDISLEATPETYRVYRRLGWPLEIVGDLRPHWGDELCYLCRMGVAEVAGAMAVRALRSAAYREIISLMSRPLGRGPDMGPPLQPAAASGIVVAG